MTISIIAARFVSKPHGWLFGQVSDSSPLANANYRGLQSKTWLKSVGLVKNRQLNRGYLSLGKRGVHGFEGQGSKHPHDRSIQVIEGVGLRWVEWTESKIVWPENGSFRTIGSIQ